jgi:hypothetical protein
MNEECVYQQVCTCEFNIWLFCCSLLHDGVVAKSKDCVRKMNKLALPELLAEMQGASVFFFFFSVRSCLKELFFKEYYSSKVI